MTILEVFGVIKIRCQSSVSAVQPERQKQLCFLGLPIALFSCVPLIFNNNFFAPKLESFILILDISGGGEGFEETGSYIALKTQAKELSSGCPVDGDMTQISSATAHQKD